MNNTTKRVLMVVCRMLAATAVIDLALMLVGLIKLDIASDPLLFILMLIAAALFVFFSRMSNTMDAAARRERDERPTGE